MYQTRLINALKNFRNSYLELSSAWRETDRDLNPDYPFNESFDELDVSKWVKNSLSRLENENTTYYLFGEEACGLYNEGKMDELIEGIMKFEIGCSIFAFKEHSTSSGELLSKMDGWNGYFQITREEYNELNSIFENRNEQGISDEF